MDKLRLLAVLFLLPLAVASPAEAQLKVGAFGGLNLSDLSGDAPPDYSYTGKTRLGFGVIGEFHLADDVWLSVQPMILPRGTGIAFESDDDEDPIEVFDLQLDYVAIPVLAKFVTVGGKVYVISGVNLSFLTGAALKDPKRGAEEIDVKDSFKSMDVAVDFGVGGQLPLGPVDIMLEARYEQGLANIADDDISVDELKTRFRSSGLQLLAGVLLPLGGGR